MSNSVNPGLVSANGATIQAGSQAAITDASGDLWTLDNGVVDENGGAAGYSANVVELAYVNNTVWQENADSNWWSWTNNSWASGANPLSGSFPSGAASAGNGAFTTASDGQIIGPNGQVYVAHGIDVLGENGPSVSTLQQDFPGINYVRLAIYDYASPAALSDYVGSLTSAGIVVELEDHTSSDGSNRGGGQGQIFSGQQLSNELNWYSSVASAFAGNPYVWFGTDNEPSVSDSSGNANPGALSDWQLATYNAVRDAGNSSPVLLEANGYPLNGQAVMAPGYSAGDYAGMTNTIWDVHYYGWWTNGSTDQGTNDAMLASIVQGVQQIRSASGTMPVLVGEYGNSTDGVNVDSNADQVIAAVQSSGLSSAAWAYFSASGDGLINGDGSLSYYGQQVAAGIEAGAAATGGASPPAPAASPATSSAQVAASANDTVVQVGSGAAITDAGGNSWSLTDGGQVAVNGATDTSTSNVIALAYVNGTVWEENSALLWWGRSNQAAAWSPNTGSTSPLPVIGVNASGTISGVDATQAGTTTVADDTFVLTLPGQATVTLGTTASALTFAGLSAVTLTGGAGSAVVTADGGTNSFTAGSGALEITGGSGADAYVYHAGSGLLTLDDLSFAKGDTLSIDGSLQGAMQAGSDGQGGTMLSFGGMGGIDLRTVTAMPNGQIQWM